MRAHRNSTLRWTALAAVLCLAGALAGCEGDDGKDGAAGQPGTDGDDGNDGAPGLSCWDLNANGVADLATEDVNKDGKVDVDDCRTPTGAYDTVSLHKGYFAENAYAPGAGQCLNCHGKVGDDIAIGKPGQPMSGHWTWEGEATNIANLPAGVRHGKKDLINNFCQAVPSNEPRCTQCHIGYGWKDKSFNFGDPKNIDCLACHDQTGNYKKHPTTAGLPDLAAMGGQAALDLVAQSVGQNGGVPPRSTCVFCHASAGGDDNVKHGDISKRMGLRKVTDPTADPKNYLDRSEDVHMGFDPKATGTQKKGGDMKCVDCHQVERDGAGNMVGHDVGGFAYHTVEQGELKECTDCHSASIHAGKSVEPIVQSHTTLACQVCHIPAFSRKVATYVDWRWGQAGASTPPATCAATPTGPDMNGVGRVTYSKQKGCFKWGTNVRPELRYYDGKWNRMVIDPDNVHDRYTTLPVDLASPAATYRTPGAKIYPFKKMTGNQPADPTYKTVLVPNLFGNATTDPDAYWVRFDWPAALASGAAYTGQKYSGSFDPARDFVDTVMLLKVDHEVAPKEMAYGRDANCSDCHLGTASDPRVDWKALGWTGDPMTGGTRPD